MRILAFFQLVILGLLCHYGTNAQVPTEDLSGLFPVVFNLATRARITANATCGEMSSEIYCKLVEHVPLFNVQNRQCDVCDARGSDPDRRHPIRNAIDGSQKWWQSPSLTNGAGFNYVTITLDLGQIYQIAYIIVKAANSPRPGNWILERSLDGVNYMPWQYFAMNNEECVRTYGIQPTIGIPTFLKDDEVICMSRYSSLNPLENGEIFVSLVNGRPGVFQPSKLLLDFTSARYVRLRFQRIRTLNADLMTFETFDPVDLDPTVTRRYFYSVKDISIGGQCICYGHASYCRRHDVSEDKLQCQCLHNTAGDNCEKCLPKFNQMPWQVGGIQNIGCKECNCHNKADECVYNATVDAANLSMDMEGKYEGGGVCLNCRDYTTGINCERCIDGFYRRSDMTPEMDRPCARCRCQETFTSTDKCVPDDSRLREGLRAGNCICKEGYAGPSCSECAFGYAGYPNCRKCVCNPAGTVDPNACSGACVCKDNVAGSRCDYCEPGHFNLDRKNPLGCTSCFCFGVSNQCKSVEWGLAQVQDLNGWVLSTLQPGDFTLLPRLFDNWLEAKTYLLKVDVVDPRAYSQDDIHYWVAPMTYLGNRLSSYGGVLRFTIKYILDDRIPAKFYLSASNLVLEGSNMSLTTNKEYLREIRETTISVPLHEDIWFHRRDNRQATREDLMQVLYKVDRILIRATYHTAQDTVYLKDVVLDSASPMVMDGSSMPNVEQCQCPAGYTGLSCESCAPGWTRVNNQLYKGICRKCQCHNHASECDPFTGKCLNCQHSTTGDNCDKCLPGFYGDPRYGNPNDCKPCACPLVSGSNFFAERCLATPKRDDRDAYQCLNCLEGYMGAKCEMCAHGFYGNPTVAGGSCRRCNCGGNIDMNTVGSCNNVTGICNQCSNNTEGEYCEKCVRGYYGSAVNGDCRPCECYDRGSNNPLCHPRNGQCSCRERFTGRKCDRCQQDYGNVDLGCERCNCSRVGSLRLTCDPISGQCQCRQGVTGMNCDSCQEGHHGTPETGCRACNCYEPGTENYSSCDPASGVCRCKPSVEGQQCDKCKDEHFGLDSGKGCTICDCDGLGSYRTTCDESTGQCLCKPGVGGRRCDACLDSFYGFSRNGCFQCKPCNKVGHVCDPITGECVCPPNTEGPNCEKCTTGGWGYNEDKGCKLCNCTVDGSASQQCDPVTGACTCTEGHYGFSCDSCLFGFFNFPNCEPCNCNGSGVLQDSCQSDICQCDQMGQCPCKSNVMGKDCEECRPGTFSLDKFNPKGCTECYCFFRTQSCKQAPYVWSTVDFPRHRMTVVDKKEDGSLLKKDLGYFYIDSENLYLPEDVVERPLYWRLIPLTSDMTLSYGGNLSLVHYFEGAIINRPPIVRPVVVMVGNGIHIEYGPTALEPLDPLEVDVPLHENFWSLRNKPGPIERRLMMVVLQNVEAIFIRAVQDGLILSAEINSITLQKAVPLGPNVTSTQIARGVEMCDCPSRYSGDSCQNPGKGFYRVPPDDKSIDFSTPETVIGYVKRCQCFGHSEICHPETGVCQDCQHSTSGDSCEMCDNGFYGVATKGTPDDCQPCACPLPFPSNNFSPSCVQGRNGMICTACKEGYTGSKCENCAPGFYGNPLTINDTCKPCNCDPAGSQGNMCNYTTGQCNCNQGVTGLTCNKCSDDKFAVENGECVSCYTGCTGILLDDLANMTFPSKFVFNASGAVYPWDKLREFERDTKILQDKLTAAEKAGVAGLQDFKDDADKYKLIADKLLAESKDTKEQADKVKEGAATILDNATSFENEVKRANKEIEDIIQDMNDLIAKLYNNSQFDMVAALKEANKILDSIEKRNFSGPYDATRNENKLAEMLSETIKDLETKNINTTKARMMIDDLLNRLRDAYNDSTEADKTAKIALDKIKDLKDLLARLKSIKDEITKINQDTKDNLLEEAKKVLEEAESNYEVSRGESDFINFGISELNNRVMELKNTLPRLIDLTRAAFEHARNLTKQAEELDDLFAKTRDLSEKAVKAAKAYMSIVDAIKEAEESANNALQAAQDSTALAGVSDLENEVNKLINKSKAQGVEAQKLLDKTNDLTKSTRSIESDLADAVRNNDRVKDLLWELKRKLSQAVPGDFANKMRTINETTEEANRIADEAVDLLKKFNDTLANKLESVKKFDIKDFNYDISTDIKQAEDEDKKAQELIQNEKDAESEFNAALRRISDITLDLDKLKEKIRDARTKVNNMKLSLQADGQCHRSYRSSLASSATNEIRLSFRLNSSTSDVLLLLVQQSPKEFLAAEIRNQNIRFSWNSGKGQGTVSHPQVIEAQKWFQVVAKRIGAVGQLKVWNLEETTEKNVQAEFATTGAGCSLMNLDDKATILLAGSSDLYPIPLGITRNNFVGIMGGVILDSDPIGTYNFKTNEENQCGAGVEVPSVRSFSHVHRFSGYGFAVFVVESYNNKRTKVEFQFKTFYEDSMLFFVGNPVLGDFLSIQLKDGKVAVAFSMGGISSISGSTNNTYNNNEWTRVIFQRNRLEGYLTVEGVETVIMKAPGDKYGLELRGSPMFFGGLPTQFKLDKFKKYIPEHPPFFYGCMQKLSFFSLPPDVDTSTLVNVETGSGCRENGIHTVHFYGDGYLMLKSDKIEFADTKNDISLTFVTTKADAILLIARDIPGENYYSISLVGGNVEARLKSDGTSPVTIKSTETFNDGKLHCISLLKDGRMTEVTVDDVQIGSADSRDISFNNVGDLYLGGSLVDTGDITPTNEKVDGCISDVIANGKLLSMSDAVQYKRADVGRCRYTDKYPPAILTSPSDNGTPSADSPASGDGSSCAVVSKAEIYDNAVTAGNENNFFFKLPEDSSSDKYMSVSFDFRTYYPNGLFAHLHNPSTGFYFGIQLIDGKLQVKYIHKKKAVKITFPKILNDGRWHYVKVEKKDRRVIASHDSEAAKIRGIRRRMSEKMPFIFGGHSDAESFADVELVPYSIRGCIRGLEFNKQEVNMSKAHVVPSIRECYKKVEAGAFFGGDAWAMIDNDFIITPTLLISMEFRTTHRAAILATVSSQRGDSGFTLELYKGKMEFTLVLNSRIHRVVSNSAKLNSYCDNEWHKVEVKLNVNSISLRLDNGKPVTMDVYGGIRSTKTRNALFLGGYKTGVHQGASISMRPFHGCLRNVQLNGRNLDWYTSYSAFANVRRTACPVV